MTFTDRFGGEEEGPLVAIGSADHIDGRLYVGMGELVLIKKQFKGFRLQCEKDWGVDVRYDGGTQGLRGGRLKGEVVQCATVPATTVVARDIPVWVVRRARRYEGTKSLRYSSSEGRKNC